MELNLKNPLAFFDLETTGINISQDRIVELAILMVKPNGEVEKMHHLINPTIPISEESSMIHGIRDEDVKDKPTFKSLAKNIAKFLEGADLAGFNHVRFDIPLLVEEFLRAGVDFEVGNRKLVDAQKIFFMMEKRTLSAAYQFYCNKELEGAHGAMADTEATYDQLVGSNMVDLSGRFVFNDKGIEVFNFGKHKGKPVTEVLEKERGYYDWMMQGDFPLDTKRKLTQIKLKGFKMG